MRFQDYAIDATEGICKDLIVNARAVPADKLDWKPMDQARSALEVLQECSQSPSWFTGILQARSFPDFNPEMMEQAMAARKEWTTVDACERVMRQNLEQLYATIRDFPDTDLDIKITLPFGKNMVRSMAEIVMGQFWNANYHLGQICYIQTMLGDKEMHMG